MIPMNEVEVAMKQLVDALEDLKNDKCCGSCDTSEETLAGEIFEGDKDDERTDESERLPVPGNADRPD